MAIIRSTGIVFTDSVPTHTPIGNDSTLVFNVSNHKFYEYVSGVWGEYAVDGENIYNTDGTLSEKRVVNAAGHEIIIYNGSFQLASNGNIDYPIDLTPIADGIGLRIFSPAYNITWDIDNEEMSLKVTNHTSGLSKKLLFDSGIGNQTWGMPTIDGVLALKSDVEDAELKSATIFLFKRSNTLPIAPSGSTTYTFATGDLSGTLSGWSQTVPANDGNPLYVTTAFIAGGGTSASVLSGVWSTVRVLATNGVNGIDGTDGTDGSNGSNGVDGDEIQLRTDSGYIQWKYSQIPTWTNLVALNDLKGDNGEFDIHDAPSTSTPVDADELGVADSASSFSLKKVTWSNIKTTLKGYFDTLYAAASSALPSGGLENQVLTKRTNDDYDVYWETPNYNNFAFTVVSKNSNFVVDEPGYAYLVSGSGVSATFNSSSSGANGGLILISNVDPSNSVTITTIGATILGTPLSSLAAGKSIMYMQTALNTFVQIATY